MHKYTFGLSDNMVSYFLESETEALVISTQKSLVYGNFFRI